MRAGGVYSAAALTRSAMVFSLLALLGCAGRRAPLGPGLFPMTPEWKTNVAEFVVSPIAVDERRVFVATRDGVVRGIDQATGETLWKVDGTPGRVAAAAGLVVVRSEDGTVWGLRPESAQITRPFPTRSRMRATASQANEAAFQSRRHPHTSRKFARTRVPSSLWTTSGWKSIP